LPGYLYYALFNIFYARNRLEEAATWLKKLKQIAQDWDQAELLVIGEIFAARLALLKGDFGAAEKALQQLEALVEQERYALRAPLVSILHVQLWLAQGNLEEASAWAAHTFFPEEPWNPLRRWEILMLVRVYLAQQRDVQAVELLARFQEHFDHPGELDAAPEWMALSVIALYRCGKSEQAMQIASRLLAITEPEGYVRLDLDTRELLMKEVLTIWLQEHPEDGNPQTGSAVPPLGVALSRSAALRMLSALQREEPGSRQERGMSSAPKPHVPQHRDVSPLSRQEQQVLRLLVAGQTYAEMAQALIVSMNTIKTQVSSIYRKLGVSRRPRPSPLPDVSTFANLSHQLLSAR